MPVLIHHNAQGHQYKLNFVQPEKNKYRKNIFFTHQTILYETFLL